jgi:hypothetical protein
MPKSGHHKGDKVSAGAPFASLRYHLIVNIVPQELSDLPIPLVAEFSKIGASFDVPNVSSHNFIPLI